jgi:hypothetical protein
MCGTRIFRQGYPAGTSLRFPTFSPADCARAERRAAGPPRQAGGAGRRAAGIAAARGGERERVSTASMSTKARVHTPPLRRPGRGPQVELGQSGRGRRAERIQARGARCDANGTQAKGRFPARRTALDATGSDVRRRDEAASRSRRAPCGPDGALHATARGIGAPRTRGGPSVQR